MVLEIDEAGVLEAFEDCGGGLLLCGGVTGEEGREVDELGMLEWFRGFIGSVGIQGSPSHPARLPSLR